jgi:hypothetical protein
MPLLPFGVAGILAPALLGTGMIGTATPTFALGVGIGVSKWIKTVPVTTIDAGSLGVGSGQLPLVVPAPLLLANITAAMASLGILGIMAPLKALGLSTGLSGAFPMGLIKTTHPGIGVGTGMAKFGSVPAAPLIIAGLAEVGMVGPSVVKIATAIGMGLNMTFATLVLPIPIVGSASPAAGAGIGFGMVI